MARKRTTTIPVRTLLPYILPAIMLSLLAVISFYNFLFFHSIVEIFSIVIAFSIFSMAWYSRRITDNDFFLFLGISFLFIAVIDTVHTLTYQGIDIFGNSANIPTQLWLVARGWQAAALCLATFYMADRKLHEYRAIAGMAVVLTLCFAAIFFWHVFPTAYIQGFGLTPFKRVSEIAIIAMFGAAMWLLYQQRKHFHRQTYRLLQLFLLLSIASEFLFTEYAGVYDGVNMSGHILKVVAYYVLYVAIVQNGLIRPYNVLFLDLKRSNRQITEMNGLLQLLNKTLRHDVLNQLAVVKADLSIYAMKGKRTPDLRDSLEAVDSSVNIIRQVGGLESAISTGARLKPYDVARAMERVSRAYPDIRFSYRGKGRVYADQALTSVIDNIFRNARDHGGTKRIDTAISVKAHMVEVTIADHGRGIPDSIRSKIFREGFTYGKSGNTGLGLYIVRKTVERYGGTVTVRKNRPRGAKFVLRLRRAV